MTRIVFDCFPGGRRRAVTLSYDDGQVHDRRLVEIFNRHGVRGTFNLNSGHLDRDGFLQTREVAGLFVGHEIAAHTVSHPHLPHLAREAVVAEIIEDRRALEKLAGYPIRGLAYPGGGYNDAVVAMLPSLGIDYARTTHIHPSFAIADDFLRWPISCHHNDAIEKAHAFLARPPLWGLQVLHVFGHSYEFDRANNWEVIDQFCALVKDKQSIWHATNIELVDYLKAARAVRASVDGKLLYNPSGQEVWFSDWDRGHDVIESIGPGATRSVG